MISNRGTPKTLDQAIQNAVDEVFAPSGSVNAAKVIKAHIRDFICQKFSYSYITATPRDMEILARVFMDLTENEAAIDVSLDYHMKRIRFQIASEDHAKQLENQLKGVLSGRNTTKQTDKE